MDWLSEHHIIHSTLGLIHTIFASLSMVFGTLVILKSKGTKRHIRIGYFYVVCMVCMNLTSFGIYNFGGFSLFHAFTIVSILTLIAGIYPAFSKFNGWYQKHYQFMSWSVIGLYCAFWAELGTRVFDMAHFWWVVVLATFLTSLFGVIIMKYNLKRKISNDPIAY
jgi:uncharacterized membrane protein